MLIAGASLICLVAISLFDRAWALNLRATPFISLSGGWDSNIASAADNQVSDVVFRGSPGLILSTDMLGTTLNLTGSFNIEYYVDNPEFNTYGRSGSYGLNTSRPIHLTDKLTFTPEARYLRSTSIYVRNSNVVGAEVQVLSNQPLPVVSSYLTEYGGGFHLNYNVSPRTQFYLTGTAVRDSYSGTGFIDTTFFTGTIGSGTRITPRTSIGPSLSGTFSDFSNGEESRIYSAVLNATYTISGFSMLTVAGGGSRWFTEGDPLAPERQDGFSPHATISYQYTRDTWHVAVGAAYQTQPSGGLEPVTKTASGSLTVSKVLVPRWTAGMNNSYIKNINVSHAGRTNYSWFNQLTLRYQMYESLGFYLAGTEVYTEYVGTMGDRNTVNRISVFLGMDARTVYTIF